MSDHIYKTVQIIGSSAKSTDDAIEKAIEKAAATLRHLDWFEVVEIRGNIQDDKVAHYQVKLNIGFRLD